MAMLADLGQLSDEDVARLYRAADDDAVMSACIAEMRRRDRAESARARAAALRDEWMVAQHADYLAADAVCRGNLLSKAGKRAGVSELALWTARERDARRWASEELCEWWDANGRLTFGEFMRQCAAANREARGVRESETATEVSSNDQHGEEQHAGAPVVGPAQAGRRRVRAADSVRPGRDRQQHARAQAGRLRHTGPVQPVAPARPVSPRRPVLPIGQPAPARGYTVTVAGRVVARGVRSADLALAICVATPQARALESAGMPLQWRNTGSTWSAGTRVCAFTVTSDERS